MRPTTAVASTRRVCLRACGTTLSVANAGSHDHVATTLTPQRRPTPPALLSAPHPAHPRCYSAVWRRTSPAPPLAHPCRCASPARTRPAPPCPPPAIAAAPPSLAATYDCLAHTALLHLTTFHLKTNPIHAKANSKTKQLPTQLSPSSYACPSHLIPSIPPCRPSSKVCPFHSLRPDPASTR
jgi:hypothetical protein